MDGEIGYKAVRQTLKDPVSAGVSSRRHARTGVEARTHPLLKEPAVNAGASDVSTPRQGDLAGVLFCCANPALNGFQSPLAQLVRAPDC